MPYTHVPQNPGDLIRSSDWNAAMAALAVLYDKLDAATGHQHTGSVEDAPPIGTAGLADGGVTTAKIADAAVTAAKLAPGVFGAAIGITVTPGLIHGQSIPVPTGFQASECVFFAFIKYITEPVMLGHDAMICQAGTNGVVTALPQATIDPNSGIATSGIVATGVALAKQGGW
jgi:hypothetical protein